MRWRLRGPADRRVIDGRRGGGANTDVVATPSASIGRAASRSRNFPAAGRRAGVVVHALAQHVEQRDADAGQVRDRLAEQLDQRQQARHLSSRQRGGAPRSIA